MKKTDGQLAGITGSAGRLLCVRGGSAERRSSVARFPARLYTGRARRGRRYDQVDPSLERRHSRRGRGQRRIRRSGTVITARHSRRWRPGEWSNHHHGTEKKGDNMSTETIQEVTAVHGRVDRSRGMIRGVKILGLESKNGRSYLPEAIRRATGLYEGQRVNVDHGKPGDSRSYADRIGTIVNVSARSDGLFGDLKFNPKHPLAEQLAWDAENSPESVGLSHDVSGKVTRRNGKATVESIDSVRSVDLVADPATTAGLFESVDSNTDPGDSIRELAASQRASNWRGDGIPSDDPQSAVQRIDSMRARDVLGRPNRSASPHG